MHDVVLDVYCCLFIAECIAYHKIIIYKMNFEKDSIAW